MADILIRRAGIEDASIIADLSRQTFYDTFAAVNTKANMDKFMNEQFSREKLMKEVETGDGIFFLAYDIDEAVGYMHMRDGNYYPEFGKSSFIEIERIYAVQSSVGKGVGSRMIEKSIDTAKNREREIIWLGVWEHNKRAIDFYTKWGFEKFGQHNFLLGNDVQTDWLMKKHL